MIAFVTLFLGLVLGPQTVEIDVDASVASVTLLLDGTTLEVRTEPPWTFEVDLGRQLEPHTMVAVAHDADGAEVGRAVQWLNLPRAHADTSVVFETGDDGTVTARLSWESVAGAVPESVDARFDGAVLPIDDPAAIRLPRFDPAQLHYLSVTLTFTDGVTTMLERTLGGTYIDNVDLEMTAVPLVATKQPKRLEDPAFVGRLLLGTDRAPVRVVGVDRGGGSVVIVPDRNARQHLSVAARRGGSASLALDRQAGWLTLGPRQRARFLWPISQRRDGVGSPYELFSGTLFADAGSYGIFHLLSRASHPTGVEQEPQRLADAVAVAGLEAAARRQPRAVLLILGDTVDDHSRLSASQARAYLEHLGVPLMVWSTVRRGPPGREDWGHVLDVTIPQRLVAATARLERTLDQQWIVWVEGLHRPQDLTLASGIKGIERAR